MTLRPSAALARYAGGQTVHQVTGATAGEIVGDVAARYPEVGTRLHDHRDIGERAW